MDILTTKDLAKRWQVGEQKIRDLVAQGKLVPIKLIKDFRFSLDYIEHIESLELEDIKTITLRDYANLKREIKTLKEENKKYKEKFEVIKSVI